MFEYTTPLVGGLLIGLSAVALMFLLGRIAGVAGIVWSAVTAQPDNAWRWLFIIGLVVGALLYHLLSGAANPLPSELPWWQAVGAGLLVGFGVRMGSGCTSGHGVCGISRLSLRGIAATVFYLLAGGVSVLLFKHGLGVI